MCTASETGAARFAVPRAGSKLTAQAVGMIDELGISGPRVLRGQLGFHDVHSPSCQPLPADGCGQTVLLAGSL